MLVYLRPFLQLTKIILSLYYSQICLKILLFDILSWLDNYIISSIRKLFVKFWGTNLASFMNTT